MSVDNYSQTRAINSTSLSPSINLPLRLQDDCCAWGSLEATGHALAPFCPVVWNTGTAEEVVCLRRSNLWLGDDSRPVDLQKLSRVSLISPTPRLSEMKLSEVEKSKPFGELFIQHQFKWKICPLHLIIFLFFQKR